MLRTIRAVVRDGKIELLEPVPLPEGVHLLVTVLTEDEQAFWQSASELALKRIWDNPEDDVYAGLLAS
ncbi:MAG: antitoxin family protein [Roseiflexus sp.]|nr:antitoxin family protein [Roseiflexus sp.]MDW8029948.1 antitoxin family protein [Armatimonadota bacterium]MDW8148687.1 antitoxin family protein [Roseiflexaceae bacterium]MDW8234602.1 antitoxin family protein [Roseiflexaceae bacterium]